MRKMALLLSCITLSASGAEFAGKWQGTIKTEMARDTTGGSIPAYMILRQEDGKITGTAGPDENLQFKIQLGISEGDRLIIEASPKEGSVLRFELSLQKNKLEGSVAENGNVIGNAQLTKLP